MMQVLSRRTKNNPTLIGEPGVGKTAIAEGMALAYRSNRGKATLFLVDADTHPQTLAILKTRAEPIGITLETFDLADIDGGFNVPENCLKVGTRIVFQRILSIGSGLGCHSF